VQDSSSFTEFCKAEHPRLVGALGLFCGDVDAAEEFAQEALARAWRDWSKVSRLDSPAAWVYRVAFNLTRSRFRHKRVEESWQRREAGSAFVTTDSDVATTVTLKRAIRRLPARQRQALLFRFYLDLSVAQSAEAMDCPQGTVKNLTYKALRSLRNLDDLSKLLEVSDVT
jgi:RNA polymerase sigma-70 factor (sigma-E family)